MAQTFIDCLACTRACTWAVGEIGGTPHQWEKTRVSYIFATRGEGTVQNYHSRFSKSRAHFDLMIRALHNSTYIRVLISGPSHVTQICLILGNKLITFLFIHMLTSRRFLKEPPYRDVKCLFPYPLLTPKVAKVGMWETFLDQGTIQVIQGPVWDTFLDRKHPSTNLKNKRN